MAPLAGWWLGKVFDGITNNRAEGRKRGIFWLMGMTPLFLIALKALLPTSTAAIRGDSQRSEQLGAVVAGAGGHAGADLLHLRSVHRLGLAPGPSGGNGRPGSHCVVLTIGVSYRFNFINYDDATEPMVYAHGTPDIKLALEQIEEISRKTVGNVYALKVAYDDETDLALGVVSPRLPEQGPPMAPAPAGTTWTRRW